jgi:hypothetical protein
MRSFRSSPIYAVTVGVAAVVVVSLAATLIAGRVLTEPTSATSNTARTQEGGGLADSAPPPTSLQDLDEWADVIVTGSVVRDLGTALWELPGDFANRPPSSSAPALKIQSVEIQVSSYVKGSGPQTLILRQAVGTAESKPRPDLSPSVGSSGLFFLKPEPADQGAGWVAPFGPEGRLIEDPASHALAFGSVGGKPVPFLAGKHLSDAVAEIRALAKGAP